MASNPYVKSVAWSKDRANFGDNVQVIVEVEGLEDDDEVEVIVEICEYSGVPGGGFVREPLDELTLNASVKDPSPRGDWVVQQTDEPSERGGVPEYQAVAHLPERGGPSSKLLKIGDLTEVAWVPPPGTPQSDPDGRVDFEGLEKIGLRATADGLKGFDAQFILLQRTRSGRSVTYTEVERLPPVPFRSGVAEVWISLKDDVSDGLRLLGAELVFEVELSYGGMPYRPSKNRSGIARNRVILELWDTLSGEQLLPGPAVDNPPTPVAWIDPEAASLGPAMPRLEAQIRKVSDQVPVNWKLRASFKRPRVSAPLEEDIVEVPADGGFESVPGTGRWLAWHTWTSWPEDRKFFGGDVTITYCFVEDIQFTAKLKIYGKNPSNQVAKSFIVANSGPDLWYFYGICKHETGNFGDPGEQYVQFRKPGSVSPRTTTAGTPVWGTAEASGPGGCGMTQITGFNGDGSTAVPRNLLWDWQANVLHGLQIMAAKQATATAFIQRQRAQMLEERSARGEAPLPPPVITYGLVTFQDGTGRIMEHAQAIKAYNGGSFCYWDNPNNRWVVKPSAAWIDADGERHENPYVSKICAEIEESSNPPIDGI